VKITGALLAILVAVFALLYQLRATIILPIPNTARLVWLKGYQGLDCVSYLNVAHGTVRDVPTGADWYTGDSKFFEVVTVFSDRYHIDETKLHPGDIAAFTGPNGAGEHVTAFLKPGVWIDSDLRRGNVAEYALQDKPANDEWFTGKVRILRWRQK
jgi:hypothetical protein